VIDGANSIHPSTDTERTAGQLLSQAGEKLAAASWAVMRRQE
jgi:hypothetical protein